MKPVYIYVVTKWFRCNDNTILQVMQAYTDYLIAFVSHWSHVDIFSLTIALNQFNANLNKLLDCIRKRDLQYLARIEESHIMFSKTE